MVDLDGSMDAGLGTTPSAVEVTAAERAINAIMTGMRNYSVFPADHASTGSLLQGVQNVVARFNEEFGELSFEVTQKQILYGDRPVYSGEATVDNPAYVLYRDGIRWFVFTKGVTEAEFAVLFKMFNHYRVIPEEPEDDLVTALWRADLPHILHEASYELWDTEVRSDLAQFKVTSPNPVLDRETVVGGHSDTIENLFASDWERIRPGGSDYQPERLCQTPEEQGVWALTPDEKLYLVRLIRDDLEYDSGEAAVALMFMVLKIEDESQVYESILNYLKEEFASSLLRRDFRRAYLILDNLQKTGDSLAAEKTWTVPIHNRFRDEISRPPTLQSLLPLWPVLSTLPGVEIKNFVGVLQLLPTKAGLTLAAMLGQVNSSHARSLITEIIASYATRDQTVLETLLSGADEDLALRMLRVVKDLPDQEEAMRMLSRVMNIANQKVRVAAGRITGWQNLY